MWPEDEEPAATSPSSPVSSFVPAPHFFQSLGFYKLWILRIFEPKNTKTVIPDTELEITNDCQTAQLVGSEHVNRESVYPVSVDSVTSGLVNSEVAKSKTVFSEAIFSGPEKFKRLYESSFWVQEYYNKDREC